MNDYDYPGTGPCEDYEFEIAELLDGELPPERARIVSMHVTSCVRCRAWRDQYAAVGRRLAATLPRPELSPAFGVQLRERLATIARESNAVRRDDEDRQYARAIATLRRGWQLPAALNGVAAAAVAVCAWIMFSTLAQHWHIAPLDDARTQLETYSAMSGAMIAAALGWAFTRVPWPRLLPRI